MIIPNFFIIGAPKCGTTALSEYLRMHPHIGFSIPKEPNYFCDDLSPRFRNFHTENDYLTSCFGHCEHTKPIAVGEASVWNLFSKTAVANIQKLNPEAKYIVMVRNPIDMVYSLHSQHLIAMYENVRDFGKAWRLQQKRAAGQNIPKLCDDPLLLQYAEVAKIGIQIQRFFERVPEERRMVIVFDDFIRDTSKIYLQVLQFLDVYTDLRCTFERVNDNKKYFSRHLHEFTFNPPDIIIEPYLLIKRIIGIENLGIMPLIRKMNIHKSSRKPLSDHMKETLLREFSEDIDLLAILLNRDLSSWKAL